MSYLNSIRFQFLHTHTCIKYIKILIKAPKHSHEWKAQRAVHILGCFNLITSHCGMLFLILNSSGSLLLPTGLHSGAPYLLFFGRLLCLWKSQVSCSTYSGHKRLCDCNWMCQASIFPTEHTLDKQCSSDFSTKNFTLRKKFSHSSKSDLKIMHEPHHGVLALTIK